MTIIYIKKITEQTSQNSDVITDKDLLLRLQEGETAVGLCLGSEKSAFHYLFQKVGQELRRYPIQKLGEVRFVLAAYSLFNEAENSFSLASTQIPKNECPTLPENSFFFTPEEIAEHFVVAEKITSPDASIVEEPVSPIAQIHR